eukprot:gnl/MRDRNA2_/MRDRNA2_121765_c0_seq1.p1 gnl/MRDRNA2_/MRDRNA2_121765_c0~~gnl/MRDRNA2_/MRDRNA2_121765_c0_seq1.p1  ORF type:complete len:448 (+),score=78.18 gnl/MRDRNA2_/MRDRNA2_121765_c0_seq1:154-1497(+)
MNDVQRNESSRHSRWGRHKQTVEIQYEVTEDDVDTVDSIERCTNVKASSSRSGKWKHKTRDHASKPSESQELDGGYAHEHHNTSATITIPVKGRLSGGEVMPRLRSHRGISEADIALGISFAPGQSDELASLIASLEAKLGPAKVKRALRDQHSRRQPIACGMPLITGHSCDYACKYCYIQDWYAFIPPTPSELSGEEVLLALLYNPHWKPSRDFIILGDVCDPFHKNLTARTLEYIRALAPLRSPLQLSTKSEVSESTALEISEISRRHQCSVQVLVSLITIRHVQAVEPTTPSVEERLMTIRRLSSHGVGVFLFMRPLIPGVTTDYADVLAAAKNAGALGVIVGSLRVSKKIYRRVKMLKAPVDIEEIDRQLQQSHGLSPESLTEHQVDIQDEPLRAAIKECAEKLGLAVVRRACCANAFVAGMTCRKPNCLMKEACETCHIDDE